MTDTHQLTRYAALLLTSGLALKTGDKLIIKFNAQQLPLVRLLAQQAYQLGAADVVFDFQDDELVLARYRHLAPTFQDQFPTEHARHTLALYHDGYAQLTLIGANPDLLATVSAQAVAKIASARRQEMTAVMQYGMANHNKWLVAAAATQEWAQKVFPTETAEVALAKLWQEIFAACQINSQDDLTWQSHHQALKKYQAYLNQKQYNALHFTNATTDLLIGLPHHHLWNAGSELTTTGERFISNLPVAEVWTMPDRLRVNGRTAITKPFSLNGQLINQLQLTFKDGKVTDFQSDQPQAIQAMLETDEGASYLGEVALVPASSPINQAGLIFYQTLFDENAASHLAFGQAYPANLVDSSTMTMAQQREHGMNHSAIHQDVMIGNQQMLVQGIDSAGAKEVIMKDGEWTI